MWYRFLLSGDALLTKVWRQAFHLKPFRADSIVQEIPFLVTSIELQQNCFVERSKLAGVQIQLSPMLYPAGLLTPCFSVLEQFRLFVSVLSPAPKLLVVFGFFTWPVFPYFSGNTNPAPAFLDVHPQHPQLTERTHHYLRLMGPLHPHLFPGVLFLRHWHP